MAAGFQVFGDHGGVQIDQNFMNYSLLQKGDLYVNTYPGNINYTVLSVNAVAPILCVRNTSGAYVAVAYFTRSGSTFTWRLVASAATTITYYVFDQIPNTQAAVGLTVFDGSGRVTFSSDYDPMRIVAANRIPDTYTSYNINWYSEFSTGFGAPYSGVFAVALGSPRTVQAASGNGATSYLYADGVRCDGGAYYTGPTHIFTMPVSTNSVLQPYGGESFLVDVGRL